MQTQTQTEDEKKQIVFPTSMISSRADFFFFSALESKLEEGSFLLVEDDDAAALRALAPRTELQGHTIQIIPAW